MLPFSYPFFIFWKVTNFYIFTELGRKEEDLLVYFKRLHLDAFFFSRLRHFVVSFDTMLYTISLATREEFFEHMALPQGDSSGDYMPVPAKGEARFKLHILFFFYLRDFFFKKFFLSRLIPFYLFFFSSGASASSRRSFLLDYGFSQFLKFRSYFAGLYLDRFAAPAEGEPIVYYDLMQHGGLRYHYFQFTDGTEKRAVKAMGKARGFHSTTK